MDVHPTKNVSIGIDPYPYVWWFTCTILDPQLSHTDCYFNLIVNIVSLIFMDQASTCFKGLRSYPPTVSEAARPSWTSGQFSYFLSLAKISYLESMLSMLVLKIKAKGHISDNLLASEHWLVTKNKHWLAKKTMTFQSINIYIYIYIISYIIYHICCLYIIYIHISYVDIPNGIIAIPMCQVRKSKEAEAAGLQGLSFNMWPGTGGTGGTVGKALWGLGKPWENHGKTMGKVICWGKIHMDCLLKIHGKTNNFWGCFSGELMFLLNVF